ncbi:tRNA preQ1(34) S-adenosylmethionine ribosyltransferase-isomerase QueA [Clostridia bacterium]|nr:tRNA preQ1(34) S-adenosylmethionine ribosyltransferase-isomerase QueA [Clostridia bacterium]
MKVEDFDYELPHDRIAQTPVEPRDSSRLMVINKENKSIEHKVFRDIEDYLHQGDVLVLNNTKVIPARIFGKKSTGANIEIMLLKNLGNDEWEALARPGKRVKKGVELTFGDRLSCVCTGIDEASGSRFIKFKYDGVFEEILDEIGLMPLPPYITEKLENKERYQTVYAKYDGSAAAPTAGLHFTKSLMKRLQDKGVILCEVVLHVGLGTFRPVKVDTIEDHKMHTEYYEVPQKTADILQKAKDEKRRVIAVGTTSVRTLESLMRDEGKIKAHKGDTDIFIYPGYEYKLVDAIITNFHLPKSTLIMLVSAFAGRELVMKAYQEAVEKEYRFFSFGDAMFIE